MPDSNEFDLVIRGCRLLQPDLSILSDATLCIRGSRIARILTGAQGACVQAARQLDGSGKLAMPGLVDAHTHAAQQLLRGSVIDELPMVWSRILVPFESNLTPQETYAGARLFCLEALKSGITAFADAGGPHMEMVAQAAAESGMRALITRSMMDSGDFVPPSMKESTAQALQRNVALYDEWNLRAGGRIRIAFGLRQAMTCTPALAEGVAALAKSLDAGVHIHLAEHLDEVSFCLRSYKMRPAEWYDSFGLLGPRTLAAHSVRLADREVSLVTQRRANPVHCPRANLGNHGFSKTPLFLLLGANVALGCDGATTGRFDLFEQARLLRSAMQARWGVEINDPLALPALETLRMLTINGARALGLDTESGTLEEGKKADLILIDLRQPHLLPNANLPKTLATSAGAGDVCDVIVDGQLLVQERRALLVDEEEICRKAGEAMLSVRRRAGLALADPYTRP